MLVLVHDDGAITATKEQNGVKGERQGVTESRSGTK
jgi:hypothetical protein